jgi:hypothetical protein
MPVELDMRLSVTYGAPHPVEAPALEALFFQPAVLLDPPE